MFWEVSDIIKTIPLNNVRELRHLELGGKPKARKNIYVDQEIKIHSVWINYENMEASMEDIFEGHTQSLILAFNG